MFRDSSLFNHARMPTEFVARLVAILEMETITIFTHSILHTNYSCHPDLVYSKIFFIVSFV